MRRADVADSDESVGRLNAIPMIEMTALLPAEQERLVACLCNESPVGQSLPEYAGSIILQRRRSVQCQRKMKICNNYMSQQTACPQAASYETSDPLAGIAQHTTLLQLH
jgi:hypothetical protein